MSRSRDTHLMVPGRRCKWELSAFRPEHDYTCPAWISALDVRMPQGSIEGQPAHGAPARSIAVNC